MAVKLGEMLIKAGLLTPQKLQEALEYQKTNGGKLGLNLVKLGFVKEEDITRVLSQQYGVPAINLSKIDIDDAVVKLIPSEVAQKYLIMPVSRTGATLTIAMVDPTNVFAMDDIKFMTGYNVEPVVASEVAIKGAIEEAPVVRLVNLILTDSIKRGASDIHIEPYEKDFRVRFRIDGVLYEIMQPPMKLRDAITSRLKIMATLVGEKIVLRLLDKENLMLDMTRLGFEQESLTKFEKAIFKPYGMVLVTGPTGSGKTNTLYSSISRVNTPETNIMTAEDPVEFNLHGINQVQMKEQIGLNFAAALRSFLRQDPNIILVGEIRDFETAEIAVKAALTGHLVLSTLHTNDAPSTVNRLMNMGIEPFLVASSVHLICAQRLVRRVCSNCKEPTPLPPPALVQAGFSPADANTVV